MIYVTAQLNIENRDTLDEYRSKAGPAMARHGGTVVASVPGPTLLEGKDGPDIAALLSFPDRDAALAWINDPEIANVHALRQASGRSQILLMD